MHHETNLVTVQQDVTYSVYYIYVGSCLQKCNKLNKSHLVGQLLNLIQNIPFVVHFQEKNCT